MDLRPVEYDPFTAFVPVDHDPFASAPTPTPAAQGKFNRIADAVVGGLQSWIETPGRAMREGITTEQAADWAAPTATGMLGLSRFPGVAADGTLGTFAGPKSKVWNKQKAAAAERMPPDTAWRETGYGREFADKKMRTEISDANAGVFAEFGAMQPHQVTTLPKVMSHSALYEAYPMLRDTKVIRREPSFGADASFNPKTNTIEISPKVKDVKNAILHEMQHKIDALEGFSRGASLDEFVSLFRRPSLDSAIGSYKKTAGEANARLTEARSDMTPKQLRGTSPWEMFDVPLEKQVHRGDVRTTNRNNLIGLGVSGTVTVGAGGHLIYQIENSKVPVKRVEHNPFEGAP